MAWKDWIEAFCSLFYPKVCVVCSQPLSKGEECICQRCNIDLPRTNLHLVPENVAEQVFWGKVEVQRASAYFYYRRGSDYCQIIHRLKYKGEKEIGEVMGRQMAAELIGSGFFDGIDYLVPVPLHKDRQRARGYNQSEHIAIGISAMTGIAILPDAIQRVKFRETQTHKSAIERRSNVGGIFTLRDSELFADKHILLIDDVFTTGSTCLACADVVSGVKSAKISVLALAMAQ